MLYPPPPESPDPASPGRSDRKSMDLAHRIRELDALVSIAEATTQCLSPSEIAEVSLERILKLTQAESGCVFVLEYSALAMLATKGMDPDLIEETATHVSRDVPSNPDGSLSDSTAIVADLFASLTDLLKQRGYQTHLCIPLVAKEETSGGIIVASRQPRNITLYSTEILNRIGQHIGSSIEKARAFLAVQSAQQMAETLQEISAVLNSSLDLETVLQWALEQMGRVIPFDHAEISFLVGDEIRPIAVRGAHKEVFLRLTRPATFFPLEREILQKRRPILVHDVTEDPRWVHWEKVPLPHVGSFIGVPLIARDEVIGEIILRKLEPNAYSLAQIPQLMTFANQAAIAIRNARLFETIQDLTESLEKKVEERTAELQRRNEELLALNALAQILSEAIDLDQMLTRTLDHIMATAGAEVGSIYLLDRERRCAILRAHRNPLGITLPDTVHLGLDDPAIQRLYEQSSLVFAAKTPFASPTMTALARQYGYDSGTALILRGREGPLGFIGIAPACEEPRTLSLLDSMVRQIGVAVEKALLHHQVAGQKRFFEDIIETADLFIVGANADGNIVLFNRGAERISGYRREEVLGEHYPTIFLPPELREEVERITKDIFAGRYPSYAEGAIITKDGERHVIRWSNMPLRDPDGEITGVIAFGQDITERVRAEKALRESEERYRSLFNHVPVGLYRTSPDGEILDVNPALVQILGYPDRETLLAVNTSDLYVDLEELKRWQILIEREGVVRNFEVRLRRYDGTVVWAEDSTRTVFDADGRVLYYEGVMEDITERKRAEEALRESEERYRRLVELSPNAILIHSDGKIVFANPATVKLLGTSGAEQLVGKSVLDFAHPDYREIAQKRIRQVLETQTGVPLIEEKIVRLDGTEIDVEIMAVPFTYQGKPAVQVVARDITKRKRAEKALARERDLLHLLMDNVPDHIFFKDRESRVIRTNGAHAQALGFADPQEMIGKTDFDFFPREYAQRYYEREQEIMRSGQPMINEELEIPLPNGQTMWLSITKIPLSDASGRITGLVGISRNITERVRAEKALRESEERFRRLAESTFEGIAFHEDGVILDANLTFARMFGYERSEVIGMNGLDLVAPEYRGSTLEKIRSQDENPYEITCIRKDRSTFEAEIRGKPIPYKGRMIRVVAIRDISGYKRLQAQLIEAERLAAMGQIAAGLAHEINNPLNSIELLLTMVRDRLESDSPDYTRLQTALKEVQRITKITTQLADMVRSSPEDRISVQLNSLLIELLILQSQLAAQKGITIVPNLDPDLPKVLGLPGQLKQVFLNVILNAIEAMPGGGTLTIKSYYDPQADTACIEFRDAGPGLTSEARAHLFEPFYTTKPDGTGLGLYVSYTIVKNHGGEISIDSEPGRGTTVTITLPAEVTRPS